ncbi:hypothetical protein TNCV_2167521 [Trichonephila clavipes]|nr:hypothetical protein TNCV_2167521 [Trichonephila clavipes]
MALYRSPLTVTLWPSSLKDSTSPYSAPNKGRLAPSKVMTAPLGDALVEALPYMIPEEMQGRTAKRLAESFNNGHQVFYF